MHSTPVAPLPLFSPPCPVPRSLPPLAPFVRYGKVAIYPRFLRPTGPLRECSPARLCWGPARSLGRSRGIASPRRGPEGGRGTRLRGRRERAPEAAPPRASAG
eukprot:869913-Prorocentrum_minimum.AAC.1